MDIKFAIFILISAVTIGAGLVVAWSKNIIHAVFALLGVFAGVLGLYVMLSADFVAIVQLLIYIGGVLVLMLFAVMLTTKIGEIKISNRAMNPFFAAILVAGLGAFIWKAYSSTCWGGAWDEEYVSTTKIIGQKLLGEYLLPFEIVSLLLVLVLVGALVLARREVKGQDCERC